MKEMKIIETTTKLNIRKRMENDSVAWSREFFVQLDNKISNITYVLTVPLT